MITFITLPSGIRIAVSADMIPTRLPGILLGERLPADEAMRIAAMTGTRAATLCSELRWIPPCRRALEKSGDYA